MVKCFVRLWEFVVLRVILFVIVSLLFILSSIMLQDWLISFLGASPFNYLITTLIVVLVCFGLAYFLNQVVFTIIDVLQLCSLSRVELLVQNKSLSSISVGWNVLRRYFAHIGLLLSLKFILKKVLTESYESVESSIKDSDLLSSFVDLLESPIAVFIKKAIFSHAFECCTYYILTNTKPNEVSGILDSADDLVKTYIRSVPALLKASIWSLIVIDIPLKILPIIVGVVVGLSSHSITELLWKVVITLAICFLCDIIVFKPFVTTAMVLGFADIDISESEVELQVTQSSDDIEDSEPEDEPEPVTSYSPANTNLPPVIPSFMSGLAPTASASNTSFSSSGLSPMSATDTEVNNVMGKLGNNLPSMSSIFSAYGTTSTQGSVERLATAFNEVQHGNNNDDLAFSGF